MHKNCSVVILAAGYSSRMGKLKFALTLSDGTTFIQRIVKQYLLFGCEEIVVVVNEEGKNYFDKSNLGEQSNFLIALNEHPERERFFSLKTGLIKLKNTQYVFIHNVDNPFADSIVLEKLYGNRAGGNFVKPIFKNKGGHPILISHKIAKNIILQNDYSIHLNNFLKSYLCKEIEVGDKNILININTKDEYLTFDF